MQYPNLQINSRSIEHGDELFVLNLPESWILDEEQLECADSLISHIDVEEFTHYPLFEGARCSTALHLFLQS